MKRALCVIVLAACVPASEEDAPAGAAGFDATPSAATQGEPFATSDGWSVRIEKLVFQVSVSASAERLGYGYSEPYVFDAQKPARVFARAIPVGPARVNMTLYGRYIGYSDNDYVDRVERINVDDETNARFSLPPDEGKQSEYTPGPSVLIAVRAERGGSVVRLDAALNITASAPPSLEEKFGVPVEVTEDAVATAEMPIDAATFFPVFDDVARSDTDGDGTVSADELAASKVLTLLEQRIANAIVR